MDSDVNVIDAPVCDICGKRFSTNGNLFRHKRRIHEVQAGRRDAEKKITCVVCQSKFTRKTYLKKHLKKYHYVEESKETLNLRDESHHNKQPRTSRNDKKFLPPLPGTYAYKIRFASEEKFKISFPVSPRDPNGEKWLCSFEDLNGIKFRVASTRRHPKRDSNIRLKKNFRCMHSTRPGRKVEQISNQNFNCPVVASMIITTSKESEEQIIIFYQNHHHNHAENCALSLNYKRVQPKIREKFPVTFDNLKNPQKAYNEHIDSNSSLRSPPLPTGVENVGPHPEICDEETLQEREWEQPLQEMNSDKVMHQFRTDFFEDLLRRAGQSLRIRDALSALIENYKNCATEESIVSACSTFGKFTGFLKKNKWTSARRIGASVTSVAHRKSFPVTRQCLQSSRSPKRSFIQEHGYNRKKC